MRQRLSRLMLVTNLICTLFYALSYPYIYAEALKTVSKNYISAEQIISCSGVVVFGILWNKIGDKLYKHYPIIVLAETIADIILMVHVLVTGNLKFYFIFNVLIYAIVTRNMANGGIRLRAKVHPDEKSRERYDNNNNIVNSVATLLGASLSIVLKLDMTMMFIFALIGNVFDNGFYYYIYKKVNKLEGEI
ncbi:MAG: hypothetical protein MJZ03_00265 [archaeon]|nr:hypothetical protein [archaeon]